MKEYETAYGTNDLDKYFSMFADDMTTWWGTSGRYEKPTAKKQYISTYPDFVKKNGGYSSCKLDDLRVQVSPAADAAISSYRLECIRKNPPEGEKPPIVYEMTSALFKREGIWKIVHFNWDVVPPPKPAS